MTADSRPNVFPVLRYADAPAAIEWLVRVFGFEKLSVHANPDGSIAHAELRFGTGVVGLSSAHKIPGNPWSEVKQGVYVYVPQVDAHHDRAVAGGAEIIMPLKNMDYGSREYGARDPEGHLWGFGTYAMSAMSSPGGDPTFFVGLYYRDTRAAVGWLTRTFGFTPLLEIPDGDGSIMHAELRLGDGIVMVEHPPQDTARWGDNTQAVYVYAADVEPLYERVRSTGVPIAQPLETTSYGARGFYLRDLEGFVWGFSTYRPAMASPTHP